MMLSQLRSAVEKSWYGPAGFTVLLLPAAWLYGLVTALRRLCYRRGILRSVKPAIPVVVVGNISVGGTGKSPVVAWLTGELAADGYSPGIVSRGYGGQAHEQPQLVTPETDPVVAGDEPVMLAKQTGRPVMVCTDRVAAVNALIAAGVDIAVADDGLQHYRMGRDFELVVVDGQRGFGNRWLLPAGPLRESVGRLRSADATMINGLNPDIRGFSFSLQPGDAVSLTGEETRELKKFAGQRVWAVAGIGNPERFHSLLLGLGIEIDRVDVPDHGTCDLGALVAKRKQPILMTHKDAVKYAADTTDDSWYVPVNLQIEASDRRAMLKLIRERITTQDG
jgi:tetraacyldisaccharide 4'-kinase